MKIPTAIAVLIIGLCYSNFAYALRTLPQDLKVVGKTVELDENLADEAVLQEDGELVEEAPMVFGGTTEEYYVQTQTRAATSELNQLKQLLKQDDQWSEKILSSLEEDINAVAKELVEKANESAGGIGLDTMLDSNLRQAMWKKVENALPEGMENEFAEYKEMVSSLQRLRDETAIKGVLVFLDDQLCLSQEQIESLQRAYAKHWDSSLNEQAGMFAINGMVFGRAVVDLAGEEEFEKTLTENQLEVFRSLSESSNFLMAVQMNAIGDADEEVNSDSVRAQCEGSLGLKIAEYQALVGLTDKQEKMLTVARKGATARVVERLEAMIKKANDNPDLMMMNPNLEVMETLLEPIVSQCTREPAWQKALKKVLDEDQLQKVEAREVQRREMAVDQVVNYLVFTMIQTTEGMQLRYDQHLKMVELIKGKMDVDRCSYFDVAFAIFKATDEELKEILTDDQWNTFKPMMDSQRASLNEMMGGEEDSDEDTDEDTDE